MKRSLILLTSLLAFLSTSMWPQASSPQPQPSSGAPKVPLSGAEPNGTKLGSPDVQPAPTTSQEAAPGTRNNIPPDPDALVVEPLVSLSASSRTPAQPPQPKTEILDNSATGPGLTTDGHDPILDPPPLPTTTTTLVGGTVRSVDHIHNKMTVAVFAGNRWRIAFDERTHIYLNGAETTQAAIKKGGRVYVDTMLDDQKHEVFARNIRLGQPTPTADADGQIAELDLERGTVSMRDQINSSPVHFQVDRSTRIVYGSNPASLRDLKPGSLVHVRFSPEQSNRGVAREIAIIATPGAAFTYVGKITYLDIHRSVLALEDSLDQKTYEVHFDPARTQARNDLSIGTEVRIVAIFDGKSYNAQSITLTKSAEAAAKDNKDKD